MCLQIPDQHFLRYSNHPVWHQQSFHDQSGLDHISFPFWHLVWKTAERLSHVCMLLCIKLLPLDWLISLISWCTGLLNNAITECIPVLCCICFKKWWLITMNVMYYRATIAQEVRVVIWLLESCRFHPPTPTPPPPYTYLPIVPGELVGALHGSLSPLVCEWVGEWEGFFLEQKALCKSSPFTIYIWSKCI